MRKESDDLLSAHNGKPCVVRLWEVPCELEAYKDNFSRVNIIVQMEELVVVGAKRPIIVVLGNRF
jgi:hypothetical protein